MHIVLNVGNLCLVWSLICVGYLQLAYYAKSLHEDHVKSQLDSSISAPGIPGLGSPSRIHAIVPAICYMAKAQLQQPRYKRYTKKIAAQCYCTIRQNPSYNCY